MNFESQNSLSLNFEKRKRSWAHSSIAQSCRDQLVDSEGATIVALSKLMQSWWYVNNCNNKEVLATKLSWIDLEERELKKTKKVLQGQMCKDKCKNHIKTETTKQAEWRTTKEIERKVNENHDDRWEWHWNMHKERSCSNHVAYSKSFLFLNLLAVSRAPSCLSVKGNHLREEAHWYGELFPCSSRS